MPTGIAFIFAFLGVVTILGGLVALFFIARELLAEIQQGSNLTYSTMELFLFRQAQEKEKVRCPHCGGTRCWDVRREGRPCGDNPTEAKTAASYLVGEHSLHGVKEAVAGWWPLPRTLAARTRPDLWRKVAGHCQIALARPRVALP